MVIYKFNVATNVLPVTFIAKSRRIDQESATEALHILNIETLLKLINFNFKKMYGQFKNDKNKLERQNNLCIILTSKTIITE